MSVADVPLILAAAGVQVVVEDTWNTEPLGPFPADNPVIVWHHDASPPGASPGALSWIKGAYAAKDASAQLWVDTFGVWHCIGKGLAWHAGKVLDGMPGNHQAIGIETDHTTGEAWPDALLSSLRKGTAALLTTWDHSAAEGLWFHKQICSPPGRKSDPDGLDIGSERAAVQALIGTPVVSPSNPTTPTTDPEELTVADISAITDRLDSIIARLDRIEKSALDDRSYANELDERIAQPVNQVKATVEGLRTRVDSLIEIVQAKK